MKQFGFHSLNNDYAVAVVAPASVYTPPGTEPFSYLLICKSKAYFPA